MDESPLPPGPAAEELFAMLYSELHLLAEHQLRRGGSALTLGTTFVESASERGVSARALSSSSVDR